MEDSQHLPSVTPRSLPNERISGTPNPFKVVTLGLSRNRNVWESKVIRLLSIIHNGIILDLVCGFSVVVLVKMFVLMFPPSGRKVHLFYLRAAVVRSGDSALDSPEVPGSCGRLIGPGRV